MAGENTVTTFAGFLKTKYAQNLVNTIPESFTLTRDAPFGRARRIGEQYHQAVRTRLEQGFTYSRGGQGAFLLTNQTAGTIAKALVDGSQGVMKSQIDYETLSKAIAKGELAYGSSGDELLKNMAMSTRKRLEIDLWFGQYNSGLAVVESVASAVYTITAASWAPGVWIGMEGAYIEAFAPASPPTTQRTGQPTLNAVDAANRKLTMSAAHTSIAAGDVLFFGGEAAGKGQRETGAWNSPVGLLALANTTTGNLFNIAVATNSIWKPESYAVGGPLTFAHVQNAATTSVVKGLDRGATVYCSTASWSDLLTEQAALRRYGGRLAGRTTLVNGGRAIEFQSSSGPLMIKPSIYCPEGFAVVCPTRGLVRVGSTDVTFKVPGMDEALMQVSDTTAGVSLFAYYNQALFCPEPGQVTLMTGIVNG